MQNVLSRMDMSLPQDVIKMTVLSPLHRGTFFVNQVSVYDESAAGRSSLFQCTPTAPPQWPRSLLILYLDVSVLWL